MFDYVRKHNRLMQLLLFILIFPAFALVGIDGYSRFNEKGTTVAKVDGQTITQPQWDEMHARVSENFRARMPNLDPKLLDSPQAKYASLERLIRERVLAASAEQSRLSISDQRLAKELSADPNIAALRGADGALDVERYKQWAGAQGLSPEGYEARVRQELSQRQVLAAVQASAFTTASLIDQNLRTYLEQREIQVQTFSAAEFAAKITPTQEQMEQFYQSNLPLFQAPESASIEYLVLDLEAAKKSVTIKAEDVKAYYDQNAARLSGQEERRASHILINAPKNASAAERAAAKAKAQALLVEAKKAPNRFAELAKQNSQDPGSASNGGDLDFFARGAMVKPFEDAVFGMNKGDISEVIETDFGYHIIALTDIKTPKQKSFEEMKPSIEADLTKQQAQKKFAELAETFTNLVYEQPDSLKPAAERLGLQVKTATDVRRKASPQVTGPLANARFLNALFTADSIEKKRNTEAIESGTNQLIAGRIVQYSAARTLPLADVQERVRKLLMAEQGAQSAKKEGAAKLAAWQAPGAVAPLPAALVVSREATQNLPAQVLEAALRADANKLPAWVGVDLGAQGYAVMRVNKALAPDGKSSHDAAMRQQIAAWWAEAESQAYYLALQQNLKVQIKVDKPTAQSGADAGAP